MRHVPKDRCGYAEYVCVGLPSDSVSYSLCQDNTAYDTYSSKRPNDLNFYNLPQAFQGVVAATPFVDLYGIGQNATCVSSFDPLTGGLLDWFAKVSVNQNYIRVYQDYNKILQGYREDIMQIPGIVLPKALISKFNTAATVCLPDWYAYIDTRISTSIGSTYVQSACVNGFSIVTYDRTNKSYKFYVTDGKAIPQVNSNGQGVVYDVQGYYEQDKWDVDVQVYLFAMYNFVDSKWQFKIQILTEQQEINRVQWQKVAMLGSIKCYKSGQQIVTHVIQAVCSPVDMRDYVSQVNIPTANDGNLYVFTYNGNSMIKKWVPVKDC